MARVLLVWTSFTVIGLAVGVAGYMLTEGMPLIDAFLNASMILSGMGPTWDLKQPSAKIFSGLYAIASGLFVVVATGFILAPLLHRMIHAFHLEDDKRSDA